MLICSVPPGMLRDGWFHYSWNSKFAKYIQLVGEPVLDCSCRDGLVTVPLLQYIDDDPNKEKLTLITKELS